MNIDYLNIVGTAHHNFKTHEMRLNKENQNLKKEIERLKEQIKLMEELFKKYEETINMLKGIDENEN